ncbi:hypothetical protein A7U60_g3888 [Sanghuangporus baumii]|uniref:Uncharacterized protein n=1 Tax=Sanghuangporus baumii TaxID=108892 RepID=A0A9Q5HZK8_SANBA|nr:hypothetical protein A7U60_g3888 [Sanghuangporus baumii]
MAPPSAYDLFVSGDLDPVATLEQFGITEKTKHNLSKIACVLASFGDFKDTGYRLKIRKDQAMAIQAIRYLLEQLATGQVLGKRKRHERESKEKKRTKTRVTATAESTTAEPADRKVCIAEEFDSCDKLSIGKDVLDAAVTLLVMSIGSNLNVAQKKMVANARAKVGEAQCESGENVEVGKLAESSTGASQPAARSSVRSQNDKDR